MLNSHVNPKAEAQHASLKAAIVATLGHESIIQNQRDAERYLVNQQMIDRVTQQMDIGLDEIDRNLLALVYTSLSYTNRYEGDPYISPEKGETPVKHSMHTASDFWIACHRALASLKEERAEVVANGEFTHMIHNGVLASLWHDADEVFGEPTTVHSVHTGKSPKKEQNEGLEVMHYALNLAMHALEENKPELFFDTARDIRNMAQVKEHGFRNILRYIAEHPAPELSPEGQMRVTRALRHYAAAEQLLPEWHEATHQARDLQSQPGEDDKFLAYGVKTADRTEGNSHYRRHVADEATMVDMSQGRFAPPSVQRSDLAARLGIDPSAKIGANGRAEMFLKSYRAIPFTSKDMMRNLTYGESKISGLFEHAHTLLQKSVACQLALASYRNLTQTLAQGPVYINRFCDDNRLAEVRPMREDGVYNDNEFLKNQQKLKTEYYAERSRIQHESEQGAKSARRRLGRVTCRQDMISAIQQVMARLEQGDIGPLYSKNEDGSKRFVGIIQRDEELPEGFNLNTGIQSQQHPNVAGGRA